MEKKALKKILVIAIVFMLTFSNYGFTLQALATSEGLSFFGFNLFGGNELDFDAYFIDADGKEKRESIADVNSEMTFVVELEPKAEGYLKSGKIKAVAEEGETNFEIIGVLTAEEEKEQNSLTQVVAPETTLLKTEQIIETVEENTLLENTTVVENTVVENVAVENTTVENLVVENTVTENMVEDNSAEEQEELVDEEAIVNEKLEAEKEETEVVKNSVKATVIATDEVEVVNVIEKTKLYIKLQFNSGEKLDVLDLYKKIDLEFTGNFINVDLEEVEISAKSELEIGWSYSKDFEVTSEYTKVSPFEVADKKGTLVENRIVVKREIEDEKYLPIKQTKIELEVPEINGKKPVTMDVKANNLKATTGKGINEIVFTKENWEYKEDTNTLAITVENKDAIYTYGEDVYVITYRYQDYVEENEIGLKTKGKVTVEEYSAIENNIKTKTLEQENIVQVNVGELITYSIGTTEDKINKGKINANYNSEEAVYESEFATTVNISVLTNDVLDEFKLKDTKEFYVDKDNVEFETQDIKYKTIGFKYGEIAELLEKGGSIEIKSNSGELLYTLNSELIKSQENCEININGEVTGVEISFKNISVNGNITVEFVKAIGKCSFDKSAFNNFETLESRVKAEVKYISSEEVVELAEIKTEKYFENSATRAEVKINKDSLSTIENNENVEIQIELNNHLEGSDLYSNPVFEIVFPKYVTNVEAKAINLLYEDELKIKETVVFTDDEVIKMQVALEGTQTKFSTGRLTHGTNIIINTNIEIDDYTPRKEDQIRLYYYNESMTNYESQTKWTVKKDVPTGILKPTNGFDVDVFSYQTPNGFVAINEIENYDGQNSRVASIRQGEEIREVAREREAQIATMKLIAMNNTGNSCTDVSLLGRIPTRDITDVKTGEKLGNNIDTIMTSGIVADSENLVSAKIYYSANVNASKDLNDENNGWIESPENITEMKSFLIVPTETVKEATLLKYTYNFEIPANLPYEAMMYGSFGAFYNNHSDIAIMYETTVADKVGLITKAGPKLEAVMSVDVGDGADVLEERMLKYTITVVNSGSVALENVIVRNPIPKYTRHQERGEFGNEGDYGFVSDGKTELTFDVGTLDVGQVKEYSYYVRTKEIPSLIGYASTLGLAGEDEDGVYYFTEDLQKIYLSELPEVYIENQAIVESNELASSVQSNTTRNKLVNANFSTSITIDYDRLLEVGYESEFTLFVSNISEKELNNVEAVFNSIKGLKFVSGSIADNTENIIYDEETGKVHFKIGNMQKDSFVILTAKMVVENIDEVNKEFDCYFELKADDVQSEYTTKIPQKFVKSNLIADISSTIVDGKIKENEEFKVTIQVTNNGEVTCTEASIDTIITDNIKITGMQFTGAKNAQMFFFTKDGKVTNSLPVLNSNESIIIEITLKTKNSPGKENLKGSIQNIIHNEYQKDLVLEIIELEIENNLLTEDEEEEEKIKEFEEELKEKQEEAEKEHENDNINKDSSEDNNDNTIVDDNEITDNNTVDNNETTEDNNKNEEDKEENQENPVEPEPPQEQQKPVEVKKYQISGLAWKDENANGIREDDEEKLSGIKVYLYDASNNTMIKSITTDVKGEYIFKDLETGKYIVGFEFDNTKYKTTAYRIQNVEEDRNSDAIENDLDIEKIKAVTDNITLIDGDISNLDIGLQVRNNFDLSIAKYITSAKVKYNNKEEIHKYDKADLAKLEIDAKKINGAIVELEYVVVVKNEGNVDGKATLIADYLPTGTSLNEKESAGWTLGSDGNAYNKTLEDTTIKAGESKELKIVLTKNMTEENTGVVSNEVEIKDTETTTETKENTNNNIKTQEIIISIRTGYTVQITLALIIITGAVIISFFIINKKIKVDLKNFKVKRIYK